MYLNSSILAIEPVSGIQAPGVRPAPAQTGHDRETANNAPPHKHVETEKPAELQAVLTQHNISLKFSHNEQTNEVVVQLVDDRTGEAIRQIPNEVSLKLAAANIKLQGQILDETV
jgi:uncharacterized FlaG/YvyC family protein